MSFLYLRPYFILTLSVLAMVGAATNASANEPDDVIEIFMAEIKNGDGASALNRTMSEEGLRLAGGKMDIVKNQISSALQIYGAYSSYEIFEDEELTSKLIRRSYFTYHEVIPIKWTFYLYQSDGEWGIVYINFTDQVQTF